jgi:hypothetical protein
MTGGEVDDATTTKETPDATGGFPRLVQLLARQACGMACRSCHVIEKRIAGKAAEVVIGQSIARRWREAHTVRIPWRVGWVSCVFPHNCFGFRHHQQMPALHRLKANLRPSVICLVLLSAVIPLIAQAPANPRSRLQAIMRDFEAEGFSGVVLVERHGTLEFLQAYGYADRRRKIRNTPDTRFEMASLTKPFWA